jgi:hypothetical protein
MATGTLAPTEPRADAFHCCLFLMRYTCGAWCMADQESLIARLLKACLHPFLFPAIPNLDLQSFTLQLHTLDPWLGAARVSSGSSAKDPAANLELDSKFIHDPHAIHHAAQILGTGPVLCWPAPIAGTARPSRLWTRSRAGHAVAVCVTRRVWGGVRCCLGLSLLCAFGERPRFRDARNRKSMAKVSPLL